MSDKMELPTHRQLNKEIATLIRRIDALEKGVIKLQDKNRAKLPHDELIERLGAYE